MIKLRFGANAQTLPELYRFHIQVPYVYEELLMDFQPLNLKPTRFFETKGATCPSEPLAH